MIVDLVAFYLNKKYVDPNGTIWTVYAVASSSPIEKKYGLLAISSDLISTYYICPSDLDKWTPISQSPSEDTNTQICGVKKDYFIYSLINDQRVYNDCQNDLVLTFHITEFGNIASYSSNCKYNFELINPDPNKFLFIIPTCINSNTFQVTVTYLGTDAFAEPIQTVKTKITSGGGKTSELDFTLGFGVTCPGLNNPEYCIGNIVLVS
jgi:hypothetical protein